MPASTTGAAVVAPASAPLSASRNCKVNSRSGEPEAPQMSW